MTRRLLTLLLCLATLLPCIALAQDQFKVLVVAIPNRYHHDYTVVAKPQFERMAQRHGVDLTWSWNSAPFRRRPVAVCRHRAAQHAGR